MPNTPAQARSKRRWPRVLAVMLSLLLLILLAGIGWVTHSERGTRASFELAAGLSNGIVNAEGISGTWSDTLHIGKLSLHLENQQIAADDVMLDVRLPKLLTGQLHIALLRIGRLGITGKMAQNDEPAKLPSSIALPLHLRIDSVQVHGGDVAWGPLNVITLGPFAFNFDYDGKRYLLNLDEFSARSTADETAFSGDLEGRAILSTASPYPLDATLSTSGETTTDNNTIRAAGQLLLHGSLKELQAAAALKIADASLNGNAMLRPFDEQLLGKADMTARAIDLSVIAAGLPKTALNVDLHAAENGSGTLSVANPAAGRYDEGRIPLHSLRVEFAQQDQAFDFRRIAAAFGSTRQPAGNASGSGKLRNGALTLTLQTDALDLQKIDGRMRTTKLAGKLDVRHADGKQEFTLALSEPLKKHRLTLDAHATVADNAINVDKMALRAGGSAADISARIALDGNQAFDAKGTIRGFDLRDLGDFAQMPTLQLNGEFAASGTRQPAMQADASFHIADSKLAGNPLSGEGRMQLRGETLDVPALALRAGDNRFNAQGRLAQSDARIAFHLDAPKLEQLGRAFGGILKLDGEVRGSVQQPRLVAEWSGSRLRLPSQLQAAMLQGKADLTLDRREKAAPLAAASIETKLQDLRIGEQLVRNLAIQTKFAAQPNAPLAIDVHADGIAGGALDADDASLAVNGTTAQHQLNLILNEHDQHWKLSANGGLMDLARTPRWQGSIASLDADGRLNAKLTEAAPLSVSADEVKLDRFNLAIGNNAVFSIEQFVRNARGLTTRGRFDHLQINDLLHYAQPDAPVSADLAVGGAWDFKLGNRLDGSFSLQRESGDVSVLGNAPVKLGLTTLQANATANGGRLALQFLAEGTQTGRIAADFTSALGSGDKRLTLASQAPLNGNVHIDAPALGWLGPMVSPMLVTEGSLHGDVTLAGSVANPRITGRMDADKLRLLFTDTGVDLKQGTLRSEFRGEQLVISELRFTNGGTLSINGPLSLVKQQLALDLSVTASQYKLIDRSDRKLVISGNGTAGWRDGRAKANGSFTADSGFFDIGSTDMPQLSDDVVIVGRNQSQGTKTIIALDLKLGLGKKGIHLQGRGLDAMLAGEINLLADGGETLRATGDLRIVSGTFKAYGRELAIEQGILRFNGPIGNPALNILAMRRGQEVEAGVSVGGTVLRPRITLVSDPTVPDAEKLSWLVLGHGLSDSGDGDIGALQAAASSLLAQGAASGVTSQIATMFGLDDFSVGTESSSSNLEERIVTLGKRISSRLYVSYKQGLESASSVLLLRYTLTKRLTVEGEAGTRSALSLFYNFAFD